MMEDVLLYAISDIERRIAAAPAYRAADWDDSFAQRSKYFRSEIEDLVAADDAIYGGMVGDHSFALGPISVTSDDGYRLLLLDWTDAARAAIADERAGA
jgi:hypothetical protein